MDFQKRQTYETLQIFAAYLCLLLISLYLSSHYIPTHGDTQLFNSQQECVQFKPFDTNYQTFLDDLNSNNLNFNELSNEILHDDYNQFEAFESDRFKGHRKNFIIEEKIGYDPFKFIANEPDFSWKYDLPTWTDGDTQKYLDNQFEKKEKKLKTNDYSYKYIAQGELNQEEQKLLYGYYFYIRIREFILQKYILVSSKKQSRSQIQSQQSKQTANINNNVKSSYNYNYNIEFSVYDSKKSHKSTLSKQLKYFLSVQTENIKFKELIKDYSKDGIYLESNNWEQKKKKIRDAPDKSKYPKKSNHKFTLSKLDSWQQHLKSLKTHFLQQLFNEFNNKMWKVPNQKLIKEYAFSSNYSDDKENKQLQKKQLIVFLESRTSIILQNYAHFQLKKDFYLNVIQDFVQTLELAWSLEGQTDDLLYEILFRVKIKSLFEYDN